MRTARFYESAQITPQAREFFDVIYLPLHKHVEGINGVVLPPVIFEGDMQEVTDQLTRAAANGAKYALVGNLGHLDLVRRAGLVVVGDYRLNVANAETVCALEKMGVNSVILSPELTMPQIRDIGGNTAVIVYGKLPLMTLEKCVIRDVAGCERCDANDVTLRDRRGVVFPILREWEHRNVIYNSLPTNMSDREDELLRAKITNRHFVFSTETAKEVNEVIHAHLTKRALTSQVRRLNS
jgi:putative protease